jgi:hypothetical protein
VDELQAYWQAKADDHLLSIQDPDEETKKRQIRRKAQIVKMRMVDDAS